MVIKGVQLTMTREHWIQVLAIVLPMALTGGIMLVTTTWYLSVAIASVRADNMTTMAALVARVAADEERIASIEKGETRNELFQTEMRSALSRVSDLLSDVRVAVGQRNHGK